jgi:hypothetical protein
MDEFGLIEQFKPGPATSVAEVLARAAAAPDREEIEQAAAERAAAEARAEEREQMMMLNRMSGDPLGNVSRCQAAVSELRGQVLELEDQLQAARGRLDRASENLAHWSGQADEIHTAVARRSSQPDDLLAPAKQALAEARVERMLAAVQARPAGRPKEVSRSRGVAVRSEHCHWCTEQGATDEQAFLIHNDPEHPLPVTSPEQWAQMQQAEQADRAERRHGSYAEIRR